MANEIVPIGIQRIEKRLDKILPLLDMDDFVNRPGQQRQAALSRALAAYCIKVIGNTDDQTAANSVTDRFHDRGIDAIYYDPKSSRLLLVQAKWSGSINWKDAGEFADGVTRLVNGEWDSFAKNPKIFDRRKEIDVALRFGTKVVIITAHHGPTAGEVSVLQRVSELARKIDDGQGLAEAIAWHQHHLLVALQGELDPPPVSANLYLANWGEIKEPYHAVFGRVQGQAIAELWKKHPHLAHMNLRDYGRSDINRVIAETAQQEPQHFWYFNNGLTIICDSIQPGLLGRLDPGAVAVFQFDGISLVNGAQTTGIVADTFDLIPEADKDKLWIQLRAIAIKTCPDGFAKRVTKYTNLQNAISVQDFVSLDPVQARIATDFALENRKYAFRWGGDSDPTGDLGCTLKEATFALACAHQDPSYAVQAKREISALWDTDSPRYKELFHDNLAATRIWNAVKIMREVDSVVASHEKDITPKAEMVASHLQRLVLYIVFQDPALSGWDTLPDPASALPTARSTAERVFDAVRKDVLQHHANEYVASLSKNFDKCRQLIARIRAPTKPRDPQRDLFSDQES